MYKKLLLLILTVCLFTSFASGLDFNSVSLNPVTPIWNSNLEINANLTQDAIMASFTLTNPLGTNVINSLNGTLTNSIWTSSQYKINQVGTWRYTVNAQNLTTSLSFNGLFTVNNTNPQIINLPSIISTSEDTPAYFNLAQYKSDLESQGENLTWTAVSLNQSIIRTPTISNIDNLTIRPELNAYGNAIIELTLKDNNLGTAKQNITVAVLPVNDLPVLSVPALTVVNNVSKSFDLTPYTSDVDSQDFTFYVDAYESNKITCSVSGSILTIISVNNFIGENAKCNISVSDNQGTSRQQLTIKSEAQNPVVSQTYVKSVDALIPKSGLTTQTILMNFTNNGNVDINSLILNVGDFISYSKNITPTQKQFDIQLPKNTTVTKTITLTADNSYPIGTYTGLVTYTYFGKTESVSIQTQVKDPSYALDMRDEYVLDDISRNRTATYIVTISNTGDTRLDNIRIIAQNYSNQNMSISMPNQISLEKGQALTFEIRTYVEETADSTKTQVGTISFLSNQYNKTEVPVYIKPHSSLKLNEVDVWVSRDGSSSSYTGKNNYKVTSVKPNSKVKYQVELKNDMSDSNSDTDLRMNDVDVKVEIRNLGGSSETERFSRFDISENSLGTTPNMVEFEIPYEIDAKTYTVYITATARDEYGGYHSDSWTQYLEVYKDSNMIAISRAELGKTELRCGESTTLDLSIINIGTDDKDAVKVTVINPFLDINYAKSDLYLHYESSSDENTYDDTVSIVVPKNAKSDTYPIEIRTFYDSTKLSAYKRLNLVVRCTNDTTNTQQSQTNTQTTTNTSLGGQQSSSQGSSQGAVIYSGGSDGASFTDSIWYPITLGGLGLIVLILIVVIIFFI